MILPENGSVVIIDDDPKQAMPIIDALSKRGIATTYFKGKGEKEIPEKPLGNVRIAIVDLQLLETDNDEHIIATRLINVLKKVISPDNGPYMLLIWSLKDRLFGEEFRKEIKNSAHGLVPVCMATLEKSKCIVRKSANSSEEIAESALKEIKTRFEEDDLAIIRESILNNFQDGEEFESTQDAFEVIEASLKSALEKAGVFHLFIMWENLIRKAGYQTVNAVSSTIEYTDLWEINMRDVLKRMAKARTGQNTLTIDLFLKAALSTFSDSFSEDLMYEIRKLSFPNYIKLESDFSIAGELDGDTFKVVLCLGRRKWIVKLLKNDRLYKGKDNIKLENIFSLANGLGGREEPFVKNIIQRHQEVPFRINTKLHLELDPTDGHIPGNVYKINILGERKKELLTTYFDNVPDDVSECHFIELEVSPICDYAQNKWKKSRFLSGIVYPATLTLKKADYFYKQTPVFLIEDDKNHSITFCYLFFKSFDVEDAKNRGELWFRIKRELLQDIISGLSGHINRPGITAVI